MIRCSIAMLLISVSASAQEVQQPAETLNTKPGHSFHADAFNEGPRQAAYLMAGMGSVHWETTTASPMAQRFFDQGLAQLHGFWYFEAERSFRQAASIDPQCAIHYWGMARANVENPKRSEGFIQQAMRRLETASKLERRLIESWNKRVLDWPEDAPAQDQDTAANAAHARRRSRDVSDEVRQKRTERLKQYAKQLEEIAQDYPKDIEVKAMLVLQYWQNQGEGIEIQSNIAIDALLSEIFRNNSRHPAHHFRIHLWDYRKEELALDAAAKCGPSAPGIAHMWHMPGHTYSRLHRYSDAAWQQEASARVDHAHMMRDRVMPDQIHNYAHNNEWLIRNWIFLGRIDEAISLAKNMIELPRHPHYNSPSGSGSASHGRQRLLSALTKYQRWQELAQLSESPFLSSGDDEDPIKEETLAWRGIALSQWGDGDSAKRIREQIAASRSALRNELNQIDASAEDTKSVPPPLLEPYAPNKDLFGSENDPALPEKVNQEFNSGEWKDKPDQERDRARKQHSLRYRYYRLGISQSALDAYLAAQQRDYRSAILLSQGAKDMVDPLHRIEWCSLADEHELAVQKATEAFNDSPGQLLPAALAACVADRAIAERPAHESIDSWRELRKRAVEQCSGLAWRADSKIPWLDRARMIAQESISEIEWGKTPAPTNDLGDRPDLESLGPVRWSPPSAPVWGTLSSNGDEVSSKSMAGKPYVLILYLGFGCLHCAEQLEKFSPQFDRFREAGIELVGVSTESPQSLAEGLKRYDKEMRIPLVSNSGLDVFKAFRCFDDFEGQPLHGTIFVDGKGRIRWQDIGHEPFMDADFVLRETKRLTRMSEQQSTSSSPDRAAQAAR